MSTADGSSQPSPAGVALRALTGMAALQTVYFLLVAAGPTRVVGIVLGLASVLLTLWWGADRRRRLAAQATLGVAIGGNLAAHYLTLGETVEARLLLVAVLLGYLAILVAGAVALVRVSLFLPALLSLLSFGAAMLMAEVILGRPWEPEKPPGPILGWRGALRHPDTMLRQFYAPGSHAFQVYPDDPRGYFERPHPLDIRFRLTVFDTSARAELLLGRGEPGTLRVEIARAPTRTAWHIQLAEQGLSVHRGDTLALRFQARADRPRSIGVALMRGQAPWRNLGYSGTVGLDTVWRDFAVPIVVTESHLRGRLQFDLGAESPSVELRGIALVHVASGDTIVSDYPRYAVRYAFNDMGCRDRDYPLERTPGTWRILALGDSYTQGAGVHAADVFTERLERQLNDARSPKSPTYEVINCGVSGYSTEDELVLYERHLARYNPDLVLLMMVWNDDRPFSEDIRLGFHERTRDRVFRTWRLLDTTLANRRVRRHDYSSAMRALVGLRRGVEARGSRLVVVIGRNSGVPEWDLLIDAVHRTVDTLTLPVLDVWGSLKAEPWREIAVLPDVDGHPNERAHAIIAREIARFLDEKNLLRPPPLSP